MEAQLEDKLEPTHSRRDFLKVLGLGATTAALPLSGCMGNISSLYENSRFAQETHKVRPLTVEITRDTESAEDAVLSVIQWAQKNFFHFYEGPDGSYGTSIYGAPSGDFDSFVEENMWTLSIEDLFRERAVGCHLATSVMATMLRSIDIPAEYTRVWEGQFSMGGHAALYLPTMNKYVHGDLIAELVAAPAEKLLQTEEELLYWSAQERSHSAQYPELFENIWLKLGRDGNDLYVRGVVMEGGSEDDFIRVDEVLPEYNLELHPLNIHGTREIFGDNVPIQELEW